MAIGTTASGFDRFRSASREVAMLAAALALCFAVAGVGGLWTSQGLAQWYPALKKPGWTPPNWVFGPVWSMLYAAMAVSAWLVWRRRASVAVGGALGLFGLQLLLNLAWSGIFFAERQPGLAFAEIVLLWFAILATALAFRRISTVAAALLIPYLLWVAFASALNFAIWRLNV